MALLTRAAARCGLPQSRVGLISRSAAAAASPAPATPPVITSIASLSVCQLVWRQNDPPNSTRTFLIYGSPPQSNELRTLQLPDSLSPMRISKSAVVQAVQQNLLSRAAARQQQVHAIVLSAPYLPSQLDEVASVAASLQLCASFWHEPEHGLHVLLSRQPQLQPTPPAGDQQQQQQQQQQHPAGGSASLPPDDEQQALQQQLTDLDSWRPVLAGLFGPGVYPLRQSQLQAARQAEQQLARQLRLADAAAWNLALQQLEARRAVRRCFAVKSLMGPQGLQAVRKLVAKHPGLVLTELPGTEKAASSSSPAGLPQPPEKPRTRRGSRATRQAAAAAAAAAGSEGEAGVVLVVSRGQLSPQELADLPPEAFTDYVETGANTGSNSSSRDGPDKPRTTSPMLGMRRLFQLAQDIARQQAPQQQQQQQGSDQQQ